MTFFLIITAAIIDIIINIIINIIIIIIAISIIITIIIFIVNVIVINITFTIWKKRFLDKILAKKFKWIFLFLTISSQMYKLIISWDFRFLHILHMIGPYLENKIFL